MELTETFGSLHRALVHFPIALLFAAVAFDAWAWYRRDERAAWAGLVLLVAGTVAALFTFVTGSFAEVWAARRLIPQDPLERHEGLATLTSWSFIGLVAFRSFLKLSQDRAFRLYLVLAALGLAALGVTGWHGGQLVSRYAAGVQGVTPPHPPTAQDLATLSERNTPDELAYSEMMHHIFGWFVLGLAFWLLYQEYDLPFGDRVRTLGPVILLAGGVFLMIFSDFDSWPLSDIKPITDREVLAHKVIATMMILIGIGAHLVRRRAVSARESRRLQNHLIGVLALAGGGLLLTHVHTTAPYSEVAEGVYLHHMGLGLLALACGAVKLWELGDAEGRRVHLWNRIWVVCLLAVAFSLITYNEGIPWYLPYRR